MFDRVGLGTVQKFLEEPRWNKLLDMVISRGPSASHLRLVPTEPDHVREKVVEVPEPKDPRSKGRRRPARYTLRIELGDCAVPIWRRIVVSSDMYLEDLHSVVCQSVGWSGTQSHKWSVAHDGPDCGYIGFPTSGDRLPPGTNEVIEAGVRLEDVLSTPGDELFHLYGRLANWRHTITLELPSDSFVHRLPICVAGAGACPPENCPGPGEFEQLLGVLASARLRSAQWTLEWIDTTFDPTRFSIREANERLPGTGRVLPAPRGTELSDLNNLIERLNTSEEPGRPGFRKVFDQAEIEVPGVEVPRGVPADVMTAGTARLRSVLTLVGAKGLRADDFYSLVDSHLDEPELGAVNLPKAKSMFAVLRGFGLLRKFDGRVALTERGARAIHDCDALWGAMVAGIPVSAGGCRRAAELLVLLAVAAGLEPADRHRFVSGATRTIRSVEVSESGWSTWERSYPTDRTAEVLGLVGATGVDLGRFGATSDAPWAKYLARAVLQR
ncbi:hypothetical protein ABH922_001055 [Rhodococcus sp. 27YEA15]|uniref:plasmid pRiA4b ORF-3 family protein n=1 Tax=Rhodococcus sp. 27YEA15 TaxID=3156259 RepID=UPI003C79FC6C